MNKFITVTGTKGFTYAFNVSHIICVMKDPDGGSVIKHTAWGSGITSTETKESYETIMEMIKS